MVKPARERPVCASFSRKLNCSISGTVKVEVASLVFWYWRPLVSGTTLVGRALLATQAHRGIEANIGVARAQRTQFGRAAAS
nr:hypothetical protein [Tanacetum cinerariifolium]